MRRRSYGMPTKFKPAKYAAEVEPLEDHSDDESNDSSDEYSKIITFKNNKIFDVPSSGDED